MSQILIGWSGRARHGKTECTLAVKRYAEYINESVGVYDIGAMILKTCIELGRLPQMKREDMTKEQIQVLIDVGKELKNEHGQDYFAQRVIAAAKADNVEVAMCPNIRLAVEADAFTKAGGKIVRINRLNPDGSQYISPDRDPNDITETALQFWPADYYLTHVTTADAQFIKMQAVTLYKYFRGYTC